MPRKLDVVAQVPHAAVRAYVMGDRAHGDATEADVEAMARLVGEALEAGAAGFTTSRTILHRSVHGLVPGTDAGAHELLTIAAAMGRAGHGVFQLISDRFGQDDERAMMGQLAELTGGPVTFSLAQNDQHPLSYRDDLAAAAEHNRQGRRVVPQVADRPVGMLFGLESSLHPFIGHPTYRDLARLPLPERVARLRRPDVRAALLADRSTAPPVVQLISTRWPQIFRLGEQPDYEPSPLESVAATARQEGRTEQEVALDWLLEDEGKALLFAPLANYASGNLDPLHEIMTHPDTVLGLGDGGAHCGLICDASMPTFLLTHWVRDRRREPKLTLEQAVHLQTARTAALYDLTDRGTITPGKRADLNLLDLDALRLHRPEMVHDLPAQGRRLVQGVDGYEMTMVAGVVTRLDGELTDALPGTLVRSG
jgi:N-acyl-D-aspartate/D-glutamate deacylase